MIISHDQDLEDECIFNMEWFIVMWIKSENIQSKWLFKCEKKMRDLIVLQKTNYSVCFEMRRKKKSVPPSIYLFENL